MAFLTVLLCFGGLLWLLVRWRKHSSKKTVKIAAGAGGPHAKGPTLELPPGKYQYSLKVAGSPVRNNAIEVAADEAWGLMIAPGGEVIPLQVY